MEQLIISTILFVVALFLLCGMVFTVFFIARGLQKIDEGVSGSSWGFRIIIIPGCILFWPVLLKKWRKATKAA